MAGGTTTQGNLPRGKCWGGLEGKETRPLCSWPPPPVPTGPVRPGHKVCRLHTHTGARVCTRGSG